MMKLASAERILDIQPIEGADKIVKAQILGWWIVVKKDEFKIGDIVSYIQIDTIVPEEAQYEFLRERSYRVRTIKLRKQISQGLIVPLPPGKYKEGDDLTSILKITKFSKEVPDEPIKAPKIWYKKYIWLFKQKVLFKLFPNLNKPSKLPFPTNEVPKTDEERIQNMPTTLTKYKDKNFTASEKLDGSSITILYTKGKYRICSRNYEMNNIDNEWSRTFINTRFHQYIDLLRINFGTDNIIVQGELIGKPQGNPYKVENQIRLFNIYVNGKRLPQHEFSAIVELWNIPAVPVISFMVFQFNTMDEILKYAEDKSKLNDQVEREGLVFRDEENTISFKVISNKFLIKNNE